MNPCFLSSVESVEWMVQLISLQLHFLMLNASVFELLNDLKKPLVLFLNKSVYLNKLLSEDSNDSLTKDSLLSPLTGVSM